MERHKNYIKINTKEEQKDLRFVLHPDKKYLDGSLAHSLFVQYSNSTCYKTDQLPCITNFTDAASVIQAYNKSLKVSTFKTNEEEDLEFFIKPFVDHAAEDGVLHHEHFIEAVIGFFDGISMYY